MASAQFYQPPPGPFEVFLASGSGRVRLTETVDYDEAKRTAKHVGGFARCKASGLVYAPPVHAWFAEGEDAVGLSALLARVLWRTRPEADWARGLTRRRPCQCTDDYACQRCLDRMAAEHEGR